MSHNNDQAGPGTWLEQTAAVAERWHAQSVAARYGDCPRPPNGGPADDLYTVRGTEFNAELRAALAAADGHVFVAGDNDVKAWCVRCDHRACIWTLRRVFLPAGTLCRPDTGPPEGVATVDTVGQGTQ